MESPKPALAILYPGNCEPLKATFHGVALVLAAVMGAYNTAAWMRRRQSHLAINATIYIAAVIWEQRHVAHHLFPCLPSLSPAIGDVNAPGEDRATQARAA
jgi:hypothetical protein